MSSHDDLTTMLHSAKEFQLKLWDIKNSHPEVPWYRYNSLASLELISLL